MSAVSITARLPWERAEGKIQPWHRDRRGRRPRLHRPASDQRPPLQVLAPQPGPHGLPPGRRGQRARPQARRRLPPVPRQAAPRHPRNRRPADRSRRSQGQWPTRKAPWPATPSPAGGTTPARPGHGSSAGTSPHAPQPCARQPCHLSQADLRPPDGSGDAPQSPFVIMAATSVSRLQPSRSGTLICRCECPDWAGVFMQRAACPPIVRATSPYLFGCINLRTSWKEPNGPAAQGLWHYTSVG